MPRRRPPQPLVDPLLTIELDPSTSGAVRLAAWADAFSASGTVSVADPDMLTGSFVSTALGELRTMRIAATTFRLERSRTRAARIPRDHLLANLIEDGSIVGRIAGREVKAGPGDILLSCLANELDVVLSDCRWLALLVPNAVLARYGRWPVRLDGAVLAAGSTPATLLGGLLRSLDALPPALPTREATRAAVTALASLASCLGLRAPTIGAARGRRDRDDQVRQIRRYIVSHLNDPTLDLAGVAGAFAISRSDLYRLLGQGAGPATLIRRLRLRGAAGDLTASPSAAMSVATIARRWGFVEERSFRRAFAREYGVAPSDWRAQGREVTTPGDHLARWFAGE